MRPNIFDGIDLLMDSRPEPRTSGIGRMLMLTSEALIPAARRLLRAGYHLEDISGLDAAEGILVTYHFDIYDPIDRIGRLVLRVLASHADPRVPSIAAVFDGAEWHERELADFFGVCFEGNPNPAALLLPEMDDSTPLRKQPAARRPVRELIRPGAIVHQAPQFDLFEADHHAPDNS